MVGVLGDMSPDWLVYYLIYVFLNYLLKRYPYFKYCDPIQKSVTKETRLQLIYCYGMTAINENIRRKSIYDKGKYRI
jgi:hypothetical protein